MNAHLRPYMLIFISLRRKKEKYFSVSGKSSTFAPLFRRNRWKEEE